MPTTDARLEILSKGEIELLGLLPFASNYTFLARVRDGDQGVQAVYKPRRGEQPLWDFPPGTLASREVAAFVTSSGLGWDIVPSTVLRDDGPLDGGSLQLFIEHDPQRHYFVMAEDRLEDFRRFAAFDVVINNADRKSGHVIEDRDGRFWALDHGVSFHVEPKLRTVIWEFAGDDIPSALRSDLERFRTSLAAGSDLRRQLVVLLSEPEVDALSARVDDFLAEGRFPSPASRWSLPWPLI